MIPNLSVMKSSSKQSIISIIFTISKLMMNLLKLIIKCI